MKHPLLIFYASMFCRCCMRRVKFPDSKLRFSTRERSTYKRRRLFENHNEISDLTNDINLNDSQEEGTSSNPKPERRSIPLPWPSYRSSFAHAEILSLRHWIQTHTTISRFQAARNLASIKTRIICQVWNFDSPFIKEEFRAYEMLKQVLNAIKDIMKEMNEEKVDEGFDMVGDELAFLERILDDRVKGRPRWLARRKGLSNESLVWDSVSIFWCGSLTICILHCLEFQVSCSSFDVLWSIGFYLQLIHYLSLLVLCL